VPMDDAAAMAERLDRLIALYAWHGDHHLGHLNIIASAQR